MKKAIASPLLSAFVLPGLGQVYNQQLRKGALLISLCSFLLMIIFGLIVIKAWAANSHMLLDPGNITFVQAFYNQMRSGGLMWLLIMLGIFLPLWVYGVLDAWRGGRKMDAAEAAGAAQAAPAQPERKQP